MPTALGLFVVTRWQGSASAPPASEAPVASSTRASPVTWLAPAASDEAASWRGTGTGRGPLAGGGRAAAEPGVPPEIRARAAIETAEALERQRPALATRCWDPLAHSGSVPVRLSMIVSFDAQGREVGRAIVDDPDGQPEIAQCLREAMGEQLRISPVGTAVDVDLEFTFP